MPSNPSPCGGCTVCCHVLQVNDTPGAAKPAGVRCPWLNRDNRGCSIYKDRPLSCQSFECLYIKLERRPDLTTSTNLRPDISGVMFVHNPVRIFFTAHVWDPKRPDAWKDPEPTAVIKRLLQEGFKVLITWGQQPKKLLLESDGYIGYTEREITMGAPDKDGIQHGSL